VAVTWQGILGHDDVVERFRRALARDRLASSFLFVGPEGIGKRTFALKLAQTLLCRTRPEAAMDPCGHCPACLQVLAGSHPDLEVVSKPADKSFLPLELLIGDKDHRLREGLCHTIAMKPFLGGRKVAIIDDADFLNAEGANCLLKTLEEPPPRSVLILIGTSPAKQLPTIRSRCQLIRFRPLAPEEVAELLAAHGLIENRQDAQRLAAHSGGSIRRAMELAAPEMWQFRSRLHEMLAAPALESVRLAASLQQFVDQAGKEASARRLRIRQVLGFAADFYEQLLRRLVELPQPDDAAPQQRARQVIEHCPADWEAVAACLERCLEGAEQVDRNANLSTLLECWLDDLARRRRAGIPACQG
jgi:DNA polymerase-3 subunit delta'